MTAGVIPKRDLPVREFYGRFKHLALAVGAALVLEQPTALLESEVDALIDEARTAAPGSGEYRPQVEAGVEASEELQALLRRRGSDVESARLAHKRLRRSVWTVIPCEYVPCCARTAHD